MLLRQPASRRRELRPGRRVGPIPEGHDGKGDAAGARHASRRRSHVGRLLLSRPLAEDDLPRRFSTSWLPVRVASLTTLLIVVLIVSLGGLLGQEATRDFAVESRSCTATLGLGPGLLEEGVMPTVEAILRTC